MILENINLQKIKKIFCYLALTLIIVIAFFIRFKYVIDREFTYDEALYAWSAEQIDDNFTHIFSQEITEFHPPLFPLLLTMGKYFLNLPASPFTYRLVMINIGLIGIGGMFFLGLRMSSYFLGLFCALSLAFNVFFIYNSVFLLNDIPFCALAIFLLLGLKNAHQNRHWKNDLLISIIASLMICTKYTGILMIPLITIFYALQPEVLGFKIKLRKFSIALSVIFLTISLLSVINYFNRGSIFPVIRAFQSSKIGSPPIDKLILIYDYIFHYIPHNFLISTFIFGCLYTLYKKKFFERFLIIYITIGLLSLLTLKEHDFRYGLFIAPALILILGIAIENLLKFIFKQKNHLLIAKISVMIMLGFWYLEKIYQVDTIIKSKVNITPNYSEAAMWVKKHATDKTTIISQEPRLMRYYTRINFKRFGGNILSLPDNRNDIGKILKEIKGDVLLDVNKRRDHIKTNFHPFGEPQKEEIFLKNHNFFLKKIIYQKKFCKEVLNDCEPKPVIKIFKHSAGNHLPLDQEKTK